MCFEEQQVKAKKLKVSRAEVAVWVLNMSEYAGHAKVDDEGGIIVDA